MADVYISCLRADHDRVRPISERLASLGYSVLWEKTAGADVDREIGEARAALIVWSGEARNATRMCAEASRALDTGKLLQVRLDASSPPPPFDALPTFDLSSERAEWGPLEAALATLVRSDAPVALKTPNVGLLATPSAAGAPKLITVALVTSLIAYAGALAEARSGVMSPDQLQLALTGVFGVASASAALCVHRLVMIARAGD
ncbi:MAG: toll/interleukin-1 receptor domain-containing protein [Terricaulis sp.]